MLWVRIILNHHSRSLTDISAVTCFPHLETTEHPSLKPLCRQCRNCNTCAELGILDNIAVGEPSVRDAQGNAVQPKKETLLERYERWSKDHERRQNEIRAKYGSDNVGMM
jgi:hypothetical protein